MGTQRDIWDLEETLEEATKLIFLLYTALDTVEGLSEEETDRVEKYLERYSTEWALLCDGLYMEQK